MKIWQPDPMQWCVIWAVYALALWIDFPVFGRQEEGKAITFLVIAGLLVLWFMEGKRRPTAAGDRQSGTRRNGEEQRRQEAARRAAEQRRRHTVGTPEHRRAARDFWLILIVCAAFIIFGLFSVS